MKLLLKYDINIVCKKVLQEQLDKLQLQYNIMGVAEVDLENNIPPEEYAQLKAILNSYGIEIIENLKIALVQKVKDAIIEMIYLEDLPSTKISSYLAEKLEQDYFYLARIFSEVTHTSIENFIILQKIERVKQLMIIDHLTLTEISYKLNYCNVSHLSTQFKKTTGLTPSAFQRIISRRRDLVNELDIKNVIDQQL